MNEVCNRCPVQARCLLDFGSKACKEVADEAGFDPTPTNGEATRSMDDFELANRVYGPCQIDGRQCPKPRVGCYSCTLAWLGEKVKTDG